MPFEDTSDPNNPRYYVIWCWKGDYWNLGAGAEIGIYYTDSQYQKENNFYLIDTSLTVTAHMVIDYRWLLGTEFSSTELSNFEQTNWWITSFTPIVQEPRIDWLDVSIDVKFTNENLITPFYLEYSHPNEENAQDWDHVTMLLNPPYTTNSLSSYLFNISY